jgi:hypothetical protein
MFQVTAVNLSADARTPVERGGPVEIGSLTPRELTALLETFTEIDPVENMRADCEIRVQYRRQRFLIRTDARKLHLQDARNLGEPAYVLTPAEIIAELDGSAAARRTTPPIPVPSASYASAGYATLTPSDNGTRSPTELPVPDAPPERRSSRVLMAVVVLLAGFAGYRLWSTRPDAGLPPLAPLARSERATQDAALTGVYMTGQEPGRHGIVILGDGRLKLFRVHGPTTPGVIHGTYELGRLDSALYLSTDQPGGRIKVLDGPALQFCGETYARIP